MPPSSLSTKWSSFQQQPATVNGISMEPSQAFMIGRERTIVEIVPVPSSSETHFIDSPLDQPQLEYNSLPAGNQQTELELPQAETEPQQSKQTEAIEYQQQNVQNQQHQHKDQDSQHQQEPQNQQQQELQNQQQLEEQNQQRHTEPALQDQLQQHPPQIQQYLPPSTNDQKQYPYFYGNNNNVPVNNNNNNNKDDQQQEHSHHYYYQQNLVQQQQLQKQQQPNINNVVAPVLNSPPPFQYGGGQLYYYNHHFGGVGKYYPLLQKHYYRARDGGRQTTRRSTRSQQLQIAHDHGGNGNFHHQLPHPHQKPPSDNGRESDNVVAIKYDLQDAQATTGVLQHQQQPAFRPSHPVWASQYPVPWMYYVKTSIVQPSRTSPTASSAYSHNSVHFGRKSRYVLQTGGAAANRIGGYSAAKQPPTKVVYIEYGGFKPKMMPSVQITPSEDFDGADDRRQSTADGEDSEHKTTARSTDAGAPSSSAAPTNTMKTTTNAAMKTQDQQPEPDQQSSAAGVVVVVVWTKANQVVNYSCK